MICPQFFHSLTSIHLTFILPISRYSARMTSTAWCVLIVISLLLSLAAGVQIGRGKTPAQSYDTDDTFILCNVRTGECH